MIKASEPTVLGEALTPGLAFDYSQMIVESIPAEQWVEEKTAKDPSYQETWDDLMGKFENSVLEGLRHECPASQFDSEAPGDVIVTVRPTRFGMGKYIGITSWPTLMDVVVGARPSDAPEELDQITFIRSHQASIIQPSVFQHISNVGRQIGMSTCRFLIAKRAR